MKVQRNRVSDWVGIVLIVLLIGSKAYVVFEKGKAKERAKVVAEQQQKTKQRSREAQAAAPAVAQAVPSQFAGYSGLTWGISRDDVQRMKGPPNARNDSGRTLCYRFPSGFRKSVEALFDGDSLSGVCVGYRCVNPQDYHNLLDKLKEVYGPPSRFRRGEWRDRSLDEIGRKYPGVDGLIGINEYHMWEAKDGGVLCSLSVPKVTAPGVGTNVWVNYGTTGRISEEWSKSMQMIGVANVVP